MTAVLKRQGYTARHRMFVHKNVAGSGQESVWHYPRPPRLERSTKTIRVVCNGELVAETCSAYRVLETSHPPTWYIPRSEVKSELLRTSNKASLCEWKGRASYWTVCAGGETVENAAWSYESPNPSFASIKGYLAFFPSRFECYVDGERALAQPGDFYGGWITGDIAGPFKGVPGSAHW